MMTDLKHVHGWGGSDVPTLSLWQNTEFKGNRYTLKYKYLLRNSFVCWIIKKWCF